MIQKRKETMLPRWKIYPYKMQITRNVQNDALWWQVNDKQRYIRESLRELRVSFSEVI